MRSLSKKTKIPYTALMLVIGAAVSVTADQIGMIGDAVQLIADIPPSGFILIFVPILVFESAFMADWHTFKKSLKQILLLAGPGVVVCLGFIAAILKLILSYQDDEISWSSALMVGSILAATDPVAVVALLKDLKAPLNFSTVVEGESLLNDGAGVVFFTIFANLAGGNKVTVGLGITSFLILCLGGIALGLLFSFVTSSWLEKTFDDSILSISITISASYLVYWVAGTVTDEIGGVEIGVSGMVALCTLGLYLSAYGKIKTFNKVEHPLHSVIEWTQYVSETLIFLIAGILCAKIFLEEEKSILPSDYWKFVAFFVLMNLARGLMVILFAPLLNCMGPKLNKKEFLVLSYAGLRGALSIALALTVNAHSEAFSARTRELVLFYVTGTAALSLLLNGTTTRLLVKKIKMINTFPAKEKILRAFNREASAFAERRYEHLRDHNLAAICDWDAVQQITGFQDSQRPDGSGAQASQSQSETKKDLSCTLLIDERDLRIEARCRILQVAKGLIWERYENGQLEMFSANVLTKAINVSLDSLDRRIDLYGFIEMYFTQDSSLDFYTKLAKIPLFGRYFRNLMVNNMIFIYDVTTSLVEVIKDLKSHVDHIPIQPEIMKAVFEEFDESQKKAAEHLSKLEDQFLSIIRYITTKRHIVHILMAEKQYVNERFAQGIIEAKEHDQLIKNIDKKLYGVNKLLKVKWEPPTFANFIATYPLLNMLDQQDIDEIIETSQKVYFKKKEVVFTEGEPFDGVYLITRGEVEIEYNMETTRKGVGHLISFVNLVTPDNVSRIHCVAVHNVEAQKLNVKVLKEIMKRNNQFELRIYKEAFQYLRFMEPRRSQDLIKLSESSIQILSAGSEIQHFEKGDTINLTHGGFIFAGSLSKENEKYGQYHMVPRNEKVISAQTAGVLIKFHNEHPFIQRESLLDRSSAKWNFEAIDSISQQKMTLIDLAGSSYKKTMMMGLADSTHSNQLNKSGFAARPNRLNKQLNQQQQDFTKSTYSNNQFNKSDFVESVQSSNKNDLTVSVHSNQLNKSELVESIRLNKQDMAGSIQSGKNEFTESVHSNQLNKSELADSIHLINKQDLAASTHSNHDEK